MAASPAVYTFTAVFRGSSGEPATATPKPPQIRRPKVGDLLHASCSDEDFGRIVEVGEDANGTPTVDVECFDVDACFHYRHRKDQDPSDPTALGYQRYPMTRFVLPAGVHGVFRDVQYRQKIEYPNHIELNMPEAGCYRCTHWLRLHSEGESP